ncbi:FAD-dependent oxidoreductase [Bosea sp. 2YAB26]|uniref:GcvT family protein n=1 Tax=Bosea sp. 2YAB26 TaxID=3237478 RepID=UPI003F8F2C68
MSIPTHSRVVIIGGGIVGCSVAYHLTKLGWRDVLLLEQGRLSSGTTWHAAGLVGQLRSQSSMTRLIRYSTELYASLEQETELATGWKRCGSVSVARTPERMTQLRRTISAARAQGVEIEELSPKEAGEKWPVMRTDDLVGGVWLPGDGKANPSDITQALARGARSRGAIVREGIRVTGIETEKGRVRAVQTDQGRVECEVLVICAGQWSRAVGQMCGVSVPLHSAEHMYIVTGKIEGVTPDLPVMRDPDGYTYYKEEVGGLVMGGFEPDAKPWGMDGIPYPFEFQLLPDDWDQFAILMENALQRVPALETAEIKTFLNGPESFTPDNNFLLGEAPEVAGVYIGAGFNSMGIASAGGAGSALAEWIVAGEATSDLWPVDIRRFASFNNNPAWLKDRIKETLGLHYAMPWPNRELDTARPFRRSPLYERLAAKQAVFGSKMGWERANYFARTEDERTIRYSFGQQNWFETVAAEHRACRETAGLVDMSSFAKFLLQGPQAEAALQRLSANDVAVPVGSSVYTALLNARGTFESDLTAARIAPDTYLLLTGTAQVTRDAHWIRRQLPEGATLTDVTSAYAVLSLAGPKVVEILARVSPVSFDPVDFPANAIRQITIGYATTWACRRSYLGEGFELYVPAEFAAAIYDLLHAAGADLGLVDVGYYAVDSLRIEKGFRAWGRELTPDINPYEAGLGFAVKLNKGDFIGRDALTIARAAPRTKRLVALVGPRPNGQMAWGGEAILADGRPVGEITSAAFGATLGGIVALGWAQSHEPIDQAWLDARNWTIDLAGTAIPVTASLAAPLDRGQARGA